MIATFEAFLTSLAATLPLELFVFFASFLEEIVAPIPSLAVLLITGSLAAIQERPFLDLVMLIILAAVGKALGSIFLYYLSHHIGELMITKFGRFFKITPKAVEDFGDKITGQPRDYLLLTFIRTLPIVPSTVVSIGCGILGVDFRLFITTMLIGTILRDSVYFYIGYTGTKFLGELAEHSEYIEGLVLKISIVAFVILLAYLHFRKTKLW